MSALPPEEIGRMMSGVEAAELILPASPGPPFRAMNTGRFRRLSASRPCQWTLDYCYSPLVPGAWETLGRSEIGINDRLVKQTQAVHPVTKG
jgi:hypothetical protein